MDRITFDTTYSRVSDIELDAYAHRIKDVTTHLQAIRQRAKLPDWYEFITVPDMPLSEDFTAAYEHVQTLDPALIILIGIGGSSLGFQAVYQSLPRANACPIVVVDTIDAAYFNTVYRYAEQLLQDKYSVVIVVVSKSGTTTEVAANFQVLYNLLVQYKNEKASEYVIAITDDSSVLCRVARACNFKLIALPAHVPGRYSVFTAAGLFPLALAGVDYTQLVAGARDVSSHITHNREDNIALYSALLMYAHYHKGTFVQDTFFFGTSYAALGGWYRQLVAESLAKQDAHKRPVGILPTISLGTNDLHSVVQRYLAGPVDSIFFTFVQSQALVASHTITPLPESQVLVEHLAGATMNEVLAAIKQGVYQAFVESARPFVVLTLPAIDAYWLGQFLQYKMIEVIYASALLEVNPFNQPHVELYKKYTRALLAQNATTP